MRLSLAAVLLALSGVEGLPAQDVGKDELRDGLRDTVLKGEWVYDDLEAGLATAKKTGKPLLVLARCVP